jgi:hypothetical protein
MAKVSMTYVKVSKMELVTKEEPRITLEMTADEAASVRGVLGRVSVGGVTTDVFRALEDVVDPAKYREVYSTVRFSRNF